MRSMATRQANLALSKYISDAVCIVKNAGFDLIILESSGIGQSDTEIVDYADISLYVMTPEYGAASQLEKIDMLDFADVIAINKSDKRGAADALRDVKKQYARNHKLWDQDADNLPVFNTMASQFNDVGVNKLYDHLIGLMNVKSGKDFKSNLLFDGEEQTGTQIIPPARVRYLSEISETVRSYNHQSIILAEAAAELQSFRKSARHCFRKKPEQLRKFLPEE